MTISATAVRFDDHSMSVDLSDGSTSRVPVVPAPHARDA